MQDVCCTTTRSWQGDPLRVPVASPRPVAHPGLSLLAPVKRIAVSSLAGRLRSPQHPIGQGAFHSPSGTLDQPCAVWMPPTLPPVGSRPAFRPLDFDQGKRPWMRICLNTERIPPVNLSLDIFQRSQRISSLGCVRVALRQFVKNSPVKPLQFTEIKS